MRSKHTQSSVSLADDRGFKDSLVDALKNSELCLFYQPRIDVVSSRATILESLVRWQRPNVGLLYPELFVAMAEKHSLNYQLDLWVFERCCQDLVWMRDCVDEDIKVAVNLSILSCESVYVSQKIIDVCASYGLLLSDFIFELADSAKTYDVRKVKAFCETLINLGAHVCLNDFGSGKVPLINLEYLPIQSLKIDRSLIANIGVSQQYDAIIRHILNLAHELDIISIAIGVENANQYGFLKQLDCKQIQGFYTGKPIPCEHLTRNMLVM